MTLRACPQCRRHFAAEPLCPFCGAAAAPPSRSIFAGHLAQHLSRAAVFAGLAGCYTREATPPAVQPPPPAPVEQQQPPPHVGTGKIEGIITASNGGQPLSQVMVELQTVAAPEPVRSVATDQNGHYEFRDVAAGDYIVKAGANSPRRGQPQQRVTVGDHDAKTVNLVVYVYDPSDAKLPYGAPPSRRRVV